MTTNQPEALRLAELLDGCWDHLDHKAATELRRLHEVNAELVAACEAAKNFIGAIPVKTKPHLDQVILVEDLSIPGRIWSQLTAALAKATGEKQ